MVYVLAKDGSPLMPTECCGEVRHMLKDGRAKCVKREPFTIQLTYETPRFTQDIMLGVDCGSRYVGLSATTEPEELFAAAYRMRKVRRHNRQIHKAKILGGGIRKRNQAAYKVNGFRLFDRVRYCGEECFVYSKRSDGRLSLKTLSIRKDLRYEKPSSLIVTSGVTYKKVTFINRQPAYVIERTVPA